MVSLRLKYTVSIISSFILGGIIIMTANYYLFPHESTAISTLPTDKDILFWYDPMRPDVQFDKPGKSPFMDMDLVAKYRDEVQPSDGQNGVHIHPGLLQNLGLKTERVRKGSLPFAERLPGSIRFNDYQFSSLQARADGFVERVFPLTQGDKVARGTPLAEMTIPAWVEAQSEYLLLSSTHGNGAQMGGILERLRLAGMPEEDIQRLRRQREIQTRFTLKAPIDGVLTLFDLRNGMNISKDKVIAQIQGIDPVWVSVAVPESLAPLLKTSTQFRLSIPAYPDEVFPIEQWYLLPGADPEMRTLQVRLQVTNKQERLKPGMNAYVALDLQGPESLLIPAEAIIDTGKQQRVITVGPQGNFVPKAIRLIQESQSYAAIEGLSEGENVVVNGLFLIDSEVNINGALQRLENQSASPMTHADHSEH